MGQILEFTSRILGETNIIWNSIWPRNTSFNWWHHTKQTPGYLCSCSYRYWSLWKSFWICCGRKWRTCFIHHCPVRNTSLLLFTLQDDRTHYTKLLQTQQRPQYRKYAMHLLKPYLLGLKRKLGVVLALNLVSMSSSLMLKVFRKNKTFLLF